jgi:hypothetical protein
LRRSQRVDRTIAEATVAVVRFSAANAEAAETLLAALQTTTPRGVAPQIAQSSNGFARL